MNAATQEQHGDLVVLTPAAAAAAAQHPSMWNEDLRPCTLPEHSWPAMKFSSLWIGMCICLPTYSLAASMIALGMNWWEAVLTIFSGSAVVMTAILLVSHAGTKFGIPYPVFARLWFGTRGAHIPALARALIAAGWFGINSWFGGQALSAILDAILPAWRGFDAGNHDGAVGIAFAVFWVINVAIAMRGPQAIGRLAQIAAPTLTVAAIALLVWALRSEGGLGPILAMPGKLHGSMFWLNFFGSMIGVIAFWATMALNIPDYTRYATSQRAQILGQIWAMPLTMALFSFVGIVVTSATVALFGTPLWNPVDLIVKFPPAVVVIGGIVVILSSVTINVGANVVAPARAFENLWPSRITFSIGAILTGILALATQPWKELSSPHTYIFDWLGAYGALLGAFDGIAIADYWFVRKCRLNLAALYSPNSVYGYADGLNGWAVVALNIGWIIALVGHFVAPLSFLWTGGWLFSLLGGLITYTLFMRGTSSAISQPEYDAITARSTSV
jgi:NCS1 family nucleobase:cation symporter-1